MFMPYLQLHDHVDEIYPLENSIIESDALYSSVYHNHSHNELRSHDRYFSDAHVDCEFCKYNPARIFKLPASAELAIHVETSYLLPEEGIHFLATSTIDRLILGRAPPVI